MRAHGFRQKAQTDSINETKQRIENECINSGNIAWVTNCNTIENYVPTSLLKEAINHIHPNNTYNNIPDDRWTNPLNNYDGSRSTKNWINLKSQDTSQKKAIRFRKISSKKSDFLRAKFERQITYQLSITKLANIQTELRR